MTGKLEPVSRYDMDTETLYVPVGEFDRACDTRAGDMRAAGKQAGALEIVPNRVNMWQGLKQMRSEDQPRLRAMVRHVRISMSKLRTAIEVEQKAARKLHAVDD